LRLALNVRTHGIILFTERFDECSTFYRDLLRLPVWFEKDQLLCLRFGTGYLMIETGGTANDQRKSSAQNPTVLRFNVDDVNATANDLRQNGIEVEIQTFNWGTIGVFSDPDGNICELKNADDQDFSY
jgi:lactoylglutathione lyase